MLEGAGEGVWREGLEPGEQGEVAVAELALAQDVRELDGVGALGGGGLLLAVVHAALVQNTCS